MKNIFNCIAIVYHETCIRILENVQDFQDIGSDEYDDTQSHILKHQEKLALRLDI